MVSIYDPDGVEKIVSEEEAESMSQAEEIFFCSPDLDFGDEMDDHWHRYERWDE